MIARFFERFDRRKYKRFNVDLCANYVVTRARINTKGEGLIRDVSYGGLKLDISDKLSKDTYLLVKIARENLDIDVTVGGKIIWIKNYRDFIRYGIKLDWFSSQDTFIDYVRIFDISNRIY